LAKKGSKFLDLPYSVKGMDMSYSGMLNYVEDMVTLHPIYGKELLNNIDVNDKRKKQKVKKVVNNKIKDFNWTKEDLCYSL